MLFSTDHQAAPLQVDSAKQTEFRTYFGDERDWFLQKRFGLFVHWGIYALTGEHEQVQWRRSISPSDYVKLAQHFCPRTFEPQMWLDLAEQAGMEYICFTVKHHDGFCMWGSDVSEFNVTKTPFRKDALALLAEACHRRGFPLCLYYSVVDWHHPNYPNQGRSHELPAPKPDDRPDLSRYMDDVRRQVTELCTRYGTIHGFWWDINALKHYDPSVNALIRHYQPAAVINDRGFDEGDFDTSERGKISAHDPGNVTARPFEACNSVGSESWGYREEEDYYSIRHLKSEICRSLARGGNYLLNVGPNADGEIPQPSQHILHRLGQWYSQVRLALCNAAPVTLKGNRSTALFTRHGNTLYVHLPQMPIATSVLLEPIDRLPVRATIMNSGRPADTLVGWLPSQHSRNEPDYLRLRNLPVDEMAGTTMVIQLDFDQIEQAWFEPGNMLS